MTTVRRLLCGTALLAAALAVVLPARTWAQSDPLLGQFVGWARDVDLAGDRAAIDREIDIVISAIEGGGLRIDWTNVTLVDGRRDVPGVKRRADQVLLTPAPDRRFFLAGVGYDPFQGKEELDATRGDPVRWAVREGDTLTVYSFVVLEDGRYELQVYERRATPDGLELAFERIEDGTVVRRMTGHAVRAE
jgi:hypothetical protein